MSKLLESVSFSLGASAYKKGLPRIPAADSLYLETVIAGLGVGEGVPYHMAWLKGWDSADKTDCNFVTMPSRQVKGSLKV